jgi:hypothetical protein
MYVKTELFQVLKSSRLPPEPMEMGEFIDLVGTL